MGLSNALLIADISHARTRPKRNAFCYHAYYLSVPLEQIASLAKLKGFGVNRSHFFAFHDKDHGACDGSSLDGWIRNILHQWHIPADGQVTLVTMPRLLGYGFNPVSFWFCEDKQGQLRAVLSEVNNTYGQRHCYLSFHADKRPIMEGDLLRAEKIFYVSPFIEISGYYEFRFAYRPDKIGVWINYFDQDGLMLTTSMTGKRIALTTGQLWRCFFRYPMVTFKVIALIHYQAFQLWRKGLRFLNRPASPPNEVSQ
jgi:DUF1365 family protein